MLRNLRYVLLIACGLIIHAACNAQELTVYKSKFSIESTVNTLTDVISSKGLFIYDIRSYEELAQKRGVEIPPTKAILFEDPALSTELIKCNQTAVIDLPLEIVVWEEYGEVYLGYIDPKLMKQRFMIQDCDDTLDKLTKLMIKIVNDAMRSQG